MTIFSESEALPLQPVGDKLIINAMRRANCAMFVLSILPPDVAK
jgi:hypothetical protein